MAKHDLALSEVREIIDKRFTEDDDLRHQWSVYKDYYENDYYEEGSLEPWDADLSANYYFANINQTLPLLTDNNPIQTCLLYTSPSPRDRTRSRMPSSA